MGVNIWDLNSDPYLENDPYDPYYITYHIMLDYTICSPYISQPPWLLPVLVLQARCLRLELFVADRRWEGMAARLRGPGHQILRLRDIVGKKHRPFRPFIPKGTDQTNLLPVALHCLSCAFMPLACKEAKTTFPLCSRPAKNPGLQVKAVALQVRLAQHLLLLRTGEGKWQAFRVEGLKQRRSTPVLSDMA